MKSDLGGVQVRRLKMNFALKASAPLAGPGEILKFWRVQTSTYQLLKLVCKSESKDNERTVFQYKIICLRGEIWDMEIWKYGLIS